MVIRISHYNIIDFSLHCRYFFVHFVLSSSGLISIWLGEGEHLRIYSSTSIRSPRSFRSIFLRFPNAVSLFLRSAVGSCTNTTIQVCIYLILEHQFGNAVAIETLFQVFFKYLRHYLNLQFLTLTDLRLSFRKKVVQRNSGYEKIS